MLWYTHVCFLFQGYDMHLVEYDSSESEYTSEESEGMTTNVNTARTSEIFNIAEPNTDRSEKRHRQRELDWEKSQSEDDDYAVVRQIKLMEGWVLIIFCQIYM